ncbi:MAG: RluA family pseudouridine synthase [Clostridia bacterium]|nr:RluA family pseudouridine synthase [Clostridia bacterium]MBR0536645.1 RluA family pseudouridine synthase [Clostridia bacterium]
MRDFAAAVAPEDDGERLDKWLSEKEGTLSRSAVQKLIEEGRVLVNGAGAVKSGRLRAGDVVEVEIPPPVELKAVPQDIPVEIVYEDEDLLVVNKPQGMVVHPAPGTPDGTLVNALLYHCAGRLSSINGVIRPGIVHRIDKDTSGLLLVAKNDRSHADLAAQIQAHSFRREYRAVVCGHMPQNAGTVNVPIGRSKTDRKKQAVHGINEKEAVTHYEVLASYPGYDFCRFVLETGRTHQIRVHAAYLGHPVAGDPVYGAGRPAPGLNGQCLHAGLVGFIHPSTREYMEFTAPLPAYFTAFLKRIEK